MDTFIVIVTKYLFILLMLFYTWESFSALIHTKRYQAAGIFQRQNAIIFVTYILGIVTIFMNQKDTTDVNVIILGGLQMCFLIVVLGIFPIIYPNINKGILSNMCMLLTIGFIILARLSFEKSVKQFIIVAVVTMLSLIVPYLMSRFNMWKSLTWIYCFVGLGLLVAVLVVGTLSRGAKLYIKISGFTFQPSEFVKLGMIICLATVIEKNSAKLNEPKTLIKVLIFAFIPVGLVLMQPDFGTAFVFILVIGSMLFVAGISLRLVVYTLLAAVASLPAFYFSLSPYQKNRILNFLHPERDITNTGYQAVQGKIH